MHIIQQKIYNYLEKKEFRDLTLREIGKTIALPDPQKPQKIKHHIEQLEKKGLIKFDRIRNIISKTKNKFSNNNLSFINVPILGFANCGNADSIANQEVQGYLKLSKSMIKNPKQVFALKAIGNSMNKANIPVIGNHHSEGINEGDYVFIDSSKRNPQNGDYVLSIIDDYANIKRFVKKENLIKLISQSSVDYPPICIHKRDFTSYMVNGLVIGVLKK